jgi:hypothetical protein
MSRNDGGCCRVARIALSRSKLKIDAWRNGALAAQECDPEVIFKGQPRQRYLEQFRDRRQMGAILGRFEQACRHPAGHTRIFRGAKQAGRASVLTHHFVTPMSDGLIAVVRVGRGVSHGYLHYVGLNGKGIATTQRIGQCARCAEGLRIPDCELDSRMVRLRFAGLAVNPFGERVVVVMAWVCHAAGLMAGSLAWEVHMNAYVELDVGLSAEA